MLMKVQIESLASRVICQLIARSLSLSLDKHGCSSMQEIKHRRRVLVSVKDYEIEVCIPRKLLMRMKQSPFLPVANRQVLQEGSAAKEVLLDREQIFDALGVRQYELRKRAYARSDFQNGFGLAHPDQS